MVETERNNEVRRRRRRSTRREMALRDQRLITALAAGQTIEELAARVDIPLRTVRARVSAILSRSPDSPAEFAQLQIRRLNEAMIVAYSAMSNGNLKAVDRVVKITREYDRYAGLAHSLAGQAAPALPAPPLALAPSALPALAAPQDDEAALDEVESA